MAKKSKVAREAHRREVVARYASRRRELKEIIRTSPDPGAVVQAQRELQRQPRDASATRLRNRDSVDGRPRGYVGKFALSRVNVRKQAHAGFLPGVTKSSW